MKQNNYENIISLYNINKHYIKNNCYIAGLKIVNLSFQTGKFYAIMGPNGSGKTTLINLLGTIDSSYDGIYKLKNQDISKLTDTKLSEIRKNDIGFIYQDFKLNFNLTAIENIMLPMLINNKIKKSSRKILATNLLELVNLKNRANHFPNELSGGEQQRIALARALANNPVIILADEPTANLDFQNTKQIFSLLKSLCKNDKCVIVVSHDNAIKKYADVIIELDEGRIKNCYEI